MRKTFAARIAVMLVAVAAGLALSGCSFKELVTDLTSHPTVESIEVAPEPEFTSMVTEYDVTGDLLAGRRPPLISIQSMDDAIDVIKDIEAPEGIALVGDFVASDDALKAIQTVIDTYGERGRDVGFLLLDMESGDGLAYNIDTQMYSASGIKGSYVCALAYYQPASVSKWRSEMRTTLVNSNNAAYEALFDASGDDNIPNRWRARAGLGSQQTGRMYTFYSVREWAQIWMVNWDFLNENAWSPNEIRGWLRSTYRSAIAKELGGNGTEGSGLKGYVSYSKAGWNGDEFKGVNDAGVVITPKGMYLLVMMTDQGGTPDDVLGPLVRALNDAYLAYVPFKQLDYSDDPAFEGWATPKYSTSKDGSVEMTDEDTKDRTAADAPAAA